MDGKNNSIPKDAFPDNAKVASVSLVEKELIDENKVSNFRPVSALNVFSKICESATKNQLTSVWKNVLSPFIGVYHQSYNTEAPAVNYHHKALHLGCCRSPRSASYNTQYALIRLLEEWRENLDKKYVVGGVLIDFSEAFDCIPMTY